MSINLENAEEKRDTKDDEKFLEFVYEKSNRFSAAFKFVRDINKRNLEKISGSDRISICDKTIAKIILCLNLPTSYAMAFYSLEYSPQNLGYKF